VLGILPTLKAGSDYMHESDETIKCGSKTGVGTVNYKGYGSRFRIGTVILGIIFFKTGTRTVIPYTWKFWR